MTTNAAGEAGPAAPTAPSTPDGTAAGTPPFRATPPSASAPPYAAPSPRRLVRSRSRWLGGVAGGLADYAGLPPALVRIGFVVAGFMGWGLFVYPVLWIVVPEA